MNSSIKKSTGSVSSSLAFRAVLALLLMVGFYVLALAVAGLLIFLIFIQIASRIFNAYLSVFCLFGAWIIMWSIFPRIDRFIPPGPRLEAKNHPRLFAELESIAGAVGQSMPAEVYLIPEVNAWVGQRGGFMGIGSRRIMGLGLPLLETLNVSQLEAVLVHEFGHYYRGDTRLGPWVYKTRNSLIRTVNSLRRHSSVLRSPFLAYGKMYLRVTQAVSRQQEYCADELSARMAGSENAMSALLVMHGAAPAWHAYWNNEVAPVVREGFIPPVAAGFSSFTHVEAVAKQVNQIIDKQSKDQKTDPYDSHPSLHDRLAALENLPAGTHTTNQTPAISLLENVPQLETELLTPIAKRLKIENLKPVKWDDVFVSVYLPSWHTIVREQESVLTGLTTDLLSETPKNIADLERRLKGVAKLTAQQQKNLAIYTVGIALTLALIKQGWSIHTSIGETVVLSKDGRSIKSFTILPRLISGDLSGAGWLNICGELGISNFNLDAKSITE